MVAFLLVVAFAAALVAILAVAGELRASGPLPKMILAGYVLRLTLQPLLSDVSLFSGGAGDKWLYRTLGVAIARIWQIEGLHFVTSADIPQLGPTSLPPNLFGLITYANGGEATPLGCTALVAFAAALVALNSYKLAVELGAEPRQALLLSAFIYFEPAFLYYTSDTFKDAFVVCFSLGAIGSALRLSRRFDFVHVVIGLVCLWALWYVRFYLIFVTVAPLVVGLTGLGSRSIARPLLAMVLVAAGAIALAGFTDILQTASAKAGETFDLATSDTTRMANAQGGSGVLFDDDGVAYGALPAKLAYTLFSPFPWAPGSWGFHIGKLDGLAWYYIIYRAIRAARQVGAQLVFTLAAFLVPCTLMYAMSMSNVGLIVRQRLVIVAVTAILAALYKPPAKAPMKTGVVALRRRHRLLSASTTTTARS